MFSLSTVWNIDRCPDGASLVAEAARLGFKALEFNFSLSEDRVKDISRQAKNQGLTVSSLHNYCPFPEAFKRADALPDCYSLAALDEDERRRAVTFTRRTIATADRVGARAVVLHCGRVEMADQTRALIRMRLSAAPGYAKVCDAFKAERADKAARHVDQIIKSLDELLPHAEDEHIILGLENRFYYREIPSLEECGILLERYKNHPLIGYWHDVGHAYIFEQLGLVPPDAWLKTHAKRLCGMHLHNIKNLQDHQAPCDGDLDIYSLTPYIKKDIIRVFEAHGHATEEELVRSRREMEAHLSGDAVLPSSSLQQPEI